MKTEEKKQIKEVMDTLHDLEKLIDERIVELYEVKGAQQSRHAYCYYRDYVWKSKYALRDILQKAAEKD